MQASSADLRRQRYERRARRAEHPIQWHEPKGGWTTAELEAGLGAARTPEESALWRTTLREHERIRQAYDRRVEIESRVAFAMMMAEARRRPTPPTPEPRATNSSKAKREHRSATRITRGPPEEADPDPSPSRSLRRDLLGRLYYIAEALEEGDSGTAHAIALDAIDELRGVA